MTFWVETAVFRRHAYFVKEKMGRVPFLLLLLLMLLLSTEKARVWIQYSKECFCDGEM